MIKKVLGRSAGGTAVAGLVLAVAPVAVSPQLVQVACPYPATVPADTTLALTRYVAPYGSVTSASVNVTSGVGTPDGQVRLVVNGKARATKTLSAGKTTFAVPRRLVAKKTHNVRVQYLGTCTYKASFDEKKYSVFKASTKTRARVVNARAAKFKARVIGSTGLVVKGGKVAFVVKKSNGTKIRVGLRKVRKGVARVDLKNLPHGSYKVVARYLGVRNYKASHGAKRFQVR